MSALDRLIAAGPKRMLVLLGNSPGAIRRGVLARIETLLRDAVDRIGHGAAATTKVIDDTGHEVPSGVEAAHTPATFALRR